MQFPNMDVTPSWTERRSSPRRAQNLNFCYDFVEDQGSVQFRFRNFPGNVHDLWSFYLVSRGEVCVVVVDSLLSYRTKRSHRISLSNILSANEHEHHPFLLRAKSRGVCLGNARGSGFCTIPSRHRIRVRTQTTIAQLARGGRAKRGGAGARRADPRERSSGMCRGAVRIGSRRSSSDPRERSGGRVEVEGPERGVAVVSKSRVKRDDFR